MKKTYREILFLLGDSAEKRRLMRTGGETVARALNDEVSSCVRVKGKDYYIVGKHPFAAFSVRSFMRYERALISPRPLSDKEARALLKKLGVRVRLGRKFGRLPWMTRRLVSLAARLTEKTATLAINLDGAPFSPRLAGRIRRSVRFLSRRYGLWISVTDSRFVPARGRAVEIRSSAVFSRLRKYRSDVLSRRKLIERIRACSAAVPALEAGKVVCVE